MGADRAASALGHTQQNKAVAYQAAKSGLTVLTRHTATLCGKHGVRTNLVSPGVILTGAAPNTTTVEWRGATRFSRPYARRGWESRRTSPPWWHCSSPTTAPTSTAGRCWSMRAPASPDLHRARARSEHAPPASRATAGDNRSRRPDPPGGRSAQQLAERIGEDLVVAGDVLERWSAGTSAPCCGTGSAGRPGWRGRRAGSPRGSGSAAAADSVPVRGAGCGEAVLHPRAELADRPRQPVVAR